MYKNIGFLLVFVFAFGLLQTANVLVVEKASGNFCKPEQTAAVGVYLQGKHTPFVPLCQN